MQLVVDFVATVSYIELSVRWHTHAELCVVTLHHMSPIFIAVESFLLLELMIGFGFHE